MQENLQWGWFTTYYKPEHEHHLPQSKPLQALQTCAKCQGHGVGPSVCHAILKKKKQLNNKIKIYSALNVSIFSQLKTEREIEKA